MWKKGDAKERKVKSNNPTFARKKGLRHFEISTKTGHNFEKPLLHLTRALMGDNRLRFMTTTANDGSQKANVKQCSSESDFATATSRLSLADVTRPNLSLFLLQRMRKIFNLGLCACVCVCRYASGGGSL